MEAIVFIGIQASGKSTFYQQRFADTHVRINLDMLRTRRREEILLDACLRARQCFVVDNTNVLAAERARYIIPAKAAGFRVVGYYFQSRLKEALQRNEQRSGRALIPAPGVIAKYRRMERPRYSEGFDQLYDVIIDENGHFVVQEWIEQPPE